MSATGGHLDGVSLEDEEDDYLIYLGDVGRFGDPEARPLGIFESRSARIIRPSLVIETCGIEETFFPPPPYYLTTGSRSHFLLL